MGIRCRVLLFIHGQWSKGVCDTQTPSTDWGVKLLWVKGVLSQWKETSQISVLDASCVESPQAVRNWLGKQWALDNWVVL